MALPDTGFVPPGFTAAGFTAAGFTAAGFAAAGFAAFSPVDAPLAGLVGPSAPAEVVLLSADESVAIDGSEEIQGIKARTPTTSKYSILRQLQGD
ncbi:MAG TPA: hypothetical protein VND64_36200 [Pirellulales bacterium]|nr:hypothetical protein [Pirellulales bacterium]